MSGIIGHQLALIKREVWEHRSIWITPAAVAFVVTFGAIAIVIMVAAFGEAVNPEIEKTSLLILGHGYFELEDFVGAENAKIGD